MARCFSIKHEETYELVAEMAARTGQSMTSAVSSAVKDRLEELKAERRAKADAWLEDLRAIPMPEDAWVEPDDPPMPEIKAIWPD